MQNNTFQKWYYYSKPIKVLYVLYQTSLGESASQLDNRFTSDRGAVLCPAGSFMLLKENNSMGEAEVVPADEKQADSGISHIEDSVVWSQEVEVCLFHAMLGHKPVGKNIKLAS